MLDWETIMQKSNYRVTINWKTEKHGYFKFFRMHLKNVMIFARSNDARIFCEWLREENATFHALLYEQYTFFDLLQISFSLSKSFLLKNKRYFYQYIYFQFHLDMFICFIEKSKPFSFHYSLYTFQKTNSR